VLCDQRRGQPVPLQNAVRPRHHARWPLRRGRDCRRRRRWPKAGQGRGRAVESIARSAHSARPLHSPKGAMHSQAPRNRHYGTAQGNPSEVRDCHQSKQSILFPLMLAADLRLCAPGRTRTCTLRIRSYRRYFSRICCGIIMAVQSPCKDHCYRLCGVLIGHHWLTVTLTANRLT
jgi:hypothetical protein